MILLNNFYEIVSEEHDGDRRIVQVRLNPAHPVFAGHFPGRPVVPGVCMVQIVKEMLGQFYGKNYLMKHALQLKFLAIINPEEVPALSVEITREKEDQNGLMVSGSFFRDKTVFMKYRALFAEQ